MSAPVYRSFWIGARHRHERPAILRACKTLHAIAETHDLPSAIAA